MRLRRRAAGIWSSGHTGLLGGDRPPHLDAVVRAVVQQEDGLKLQVDFGHAQTALIDPRRIIEE
jgi:hypothetical protein